MRQEGSVLDRRLHDLVPQAVRCGARVRRHPAPRQVTAIVREVESSLSGHVLHELVHQRLGQRVDSYVLAYDGDRACKNDGMQCGISCVSNRSRPATFRFPLLSLPITEPHGPAAVAVLLDVVL
jgi:hypothetical protein